jgi:hypothetical protein
MMPVAERPDGSRFQVMAAWLLNSCRDLSASFAMPPRGVVRIDHRAQFGEHETAFDHAAGGDISLGAGEGFEDGFDGGRRPGRRILTVATSGSIVARIRVLFYQQSR